MNIQDPWPWYIAGPLIGLTVPLLLLIGNKSFGISSSLRHICAACFPSGIPFFKYDWRKETWNLIFVAGVFLGGMIAARFISNGNPLIISESLVSELKTYGISDFSKAAPVELFSWNSLFTVKGFVLMIVGGLMVGFGTRYAGGCTSGHSIMGISNLQPGSLIATCCFMAGGFFMANLILPYLLKLP